MLLGMEQDCRKFVLDGKRGCGDQDTKIHTLEFVGIKSIINYGFFNSDTYHVWFFLRWGKMKDKITDIVIPQQYYIPSFLVLTHESGQEKNLSILKKYKEISQFYDSRLHYLFYYRNDDAISQNTVSKEMSKVIQSLKMTQFDIDKSSDVAPKLEIIASDVLNYDAIHCTML